MPREELQHEIDEGVMLTHLRQMEEGPVLVGTWADAGWVIRFR